MVSRYAGLISISTLLRFSVSLLGMALEKTRSPLLASVKSLIISAPPGDPIKILVC
jgi:hypothetical protein